jgi:hypothetical protein
VRRAAALIGATLLMAALPAAASAKPPEKTVVSVQDAACFGLAAGERTVDLMGSVDDVGTDAFLDVWSGAPFESDVILTADFDAPATVVFSGDTVTMSIPLVSTGVDPTVTEGTATVSGTRTAVAPIQVRDQFRNGNRTERIVVNGTEYVLTGTLTLPGDAPVPLDPAVCNGAAFTQQSFTNNANSAIRVFSVNGGECELVNEDGDTATLFPFIDGGFFAIDGIVTDAAGTQIGVNGSGDADATGSASFPVDEYDPDTFESLGTTGSATLAVVGSGEAFGYTLRSSSGFARVRGVLLDLEGTLSTSVGDFDLGSCVSTLGESKEVTTPSSGPQPGGKRPANDLPSGAITLKPGGKATAATKGAQVAAEGEYPCLTFTDPFDGTEVSAFGEHTVWYKVAGTGRQVTVDTAGSSFDTVLAVYEGSPDGEVVACVDDTPLEPVGRTLQAQATFPTTAGTTYWVQVGGLNEEPVFGPDASVPYGTLKIKVR